MTTRPIQVWNGSAWEDVAVQAVDAVSTNGGSTITASGVGVKPLTVKGASGQTANLLEAQNSTGAVVAAIDADGDFTYKGGDLTTLLAAKAPTASPTFTGQAIITGSVPGYLMVESDSSNSEGQLYHNAGSLVISADQNNVAASSAIIIGVDGTERVRLNSSGHLGVGTGTPLNRLDVRNTAITGGAPASSGSAADPNAVTRFVAGGVACDMGVYASGTWWIQSRLSTDYSSNTSLILQPNGGALGCPGVYNNTSASAANVVVVSDGSLLRSTSSRKYKTDVQPATEQDANAVLHLEPVTYRSLSDADDPDVRWWGLIAEDVEAVDPRWVSHNADGEPEGVQYDRLVPALISVVKRQQAQIDALTARLDAAGL